MTTTSTYGSQTKSQPAPRIVFSARAWFLCWAYVDICDVEISWMGRILNKFDDQGHYFYIDEVFLLKQECGPSETTLDAEALGSLISTLPPEDINRIRCWCHSHVNMDVYWSGTDTAAMRQLRGGGVNIYVVFNKKGKLRACVDVAEGFHNYTVDAVTNVSYEKKEIAEIIAEVSDKLADQLGMDQDAAFALLNKFARETKLVPGDTGAAIIPDDVMEFAKEEVKAKVSKRPTYYKPYSAPYPAYDKKKQAALIDDNVDAEGNAAWLEAYGEHMTPAERRRFEHDKDWDEYVNEKEGRVSGNPRRNASQTRVGRTPIK